MTTAMDRRGFLRLSLVGACAAVSATPAEKPMRGIFPIMQTPFDDAGKVDLAVLAKEVDFLSRCGVHGMVWPQLASEYSELKPDERFAGAEAIMKASAGRKPAIVIGVQGPDIESAVRYAKHAEQLKPDAIIAIPLRNTTDKSAIAAYYRAIGEACSRPLFIQTIGDFPIDYVLGLAKEVPTLRFVKDEAPPTLPRISEYRRRAPELAIFSGNHGRTLPDELARGAAGSMPASPFADLYVQFWDLWHAGKKQEAMEMFARTMLLINTANTYGTEGVKYMLELRGVFKTHTARGKANEMFDDEGRAAIRQAMDAMKRYFKA